MMYTFANMEEALPYKTSPEKLPDTLHELLAALLQRSGRIKDPTLIEDVRKGVSNFNMRYFVSIVSEAIDDQTIKPDDPYLAKLKLLVSQQPELVKETDTSKELQLPDNPTVTADEHGVLIIGGVLQVIKVSNTVSENTSLVQAWRKRFHTQLVKALDVTGISLRRFATEATINLSKMRNLQSGNGKLDMDICEKVASELNVKVEWLFSTDKYPNDSN